jgi:hypothetical protein
VRLVVRLLGALGVECGDRPVEIGAAKERLLLVLLALNAGRVVAGLGLLPSPLHTTGSWEARPSTRSASTRGRSAAAKGPAQDRGRYCSGLRASAEIGHIH